MLYLDLIFKNNIANTIKPEISHCLIYNSPFSRTQIYSYFFPVAMPISDYARNKRSLSAGKKGVKTEDICVFVPNSKANNRKYQRSLKVSGNYV
jgi:hypothetical protein